MSALPPDIPPELYKAVEAEAERMVDCGVLRHAGVDLNGQVVYEPTEEAVEHAEELVLLALLTGPNEMDKLRASTKALMAHYREQNERRKGQAS